MSSRSRTPYLTRSAQHPHPLARRLLSIAHSKKTNLVLSADLLDTASLLRCADTLGPYIAVLKTHVDILSDFTTSSSSFMANLKSLAQKHNFLIFEDRKLVDIGATSVKQYHGGALQISEWADLVNVSILGGEGIVEALDKVITQNKGSCFQEQQRGLLILAEMTSRGSLAVGEYTARSMDVAKKFPASVVGFVATRALGCVLVEREGEEGIDGEYEDLVVFTTGVNMRDEGDDLGQQYQTPEKAVAGGSDFIIAGRGIYAADDPVDAAKRYRAAGWEAYLKRIKE